jgi:transcriptional regulator with XRE-family HTH domain
MKHEEPVPFEVAEQIRLLGTYVRLARIRRGMGQVELARASHMARTTLQRIEAGSPGSAIGAIYTALWTLGLLPAASGLADPETDEHGKTLEAARLAKRVRRARAQPDDNNF